MAVFIHRIRWNKLLWHSKLPMSRQTPASGLLVCRYPQCPPYYLNSILYLIAFHSIFASTIAYIYQIFLLLQTKGYFLNTLIFLYSISLHMILTPCTVVFLAWVAWFKHQTSFSRFSSLNSSNWKHHYVSFSYDSKQTRSNLHYRFDLYLYVKPILLTVNKVPALSPS